MDSRKRLKIFFSPLGHNILTYSYNFALGEISCKHFEKKIKKDGPVTQVRAGLWLRLTFCVRNYVIVFFHHHQELKPRPLNQNVLKFLEMSTNNV